MSFILNIGLKTNTEETLNATHALNVVEAAGFKVKAQSLEFSSTELTLVVMCIGTVGENRTRIDNLCKVLKQDCVAAYDMYRRVGELIGPKAAEWGEFNPAFFLLLDGTTLDVNTHQLEKVL